ncbi:MAG: hypothetical protein ACXQS5_02355 [Candidatus Methanospirareceae archaeon]
MRKPAEKMSPSQRLAQSFLVKGVIEGLSGRATYRILREMGLGYNYNEFWKDWNYWHEQIQKSYRMRYVRRDARISEDLYIPNEWRTKGGYQTVFRVEGRDPVTGERKVFHVTVAHERMVAGRAEPETEQVYTRGELEERVYSMLAYRVQAGELEIERVMPVMGYKNLKHFR